MKMQQSGAGNATVTAPGSTGEGGGTIEKKIINQELWQACAGPLVNLPVAGTHVIYFPQGHSEQVAASLRKDVDGQIPNYPNLPSKLLCVVHNVTLHADPETDEVYAQMTLQPVASFDKEALLRSDLSLKSNKPQTEFFCKTLTASDTSTHGGFSVPRRAAEKIFPSLDFSMQPPAQELVARDLHDTLWTFRHIYRGQPKRHLLTTGWSLFVSGKRLFAGDSVLFIRDEKQQLLLGIRRANRQPTNLSSSVLSSDSMHIGILAAAAHAAANNSPFTIFYNPRASPSEFVIPLAKYYKAVNSYQLSLGMRFRMMFETEESGTRRYMGTITGISDLDTVRWKNSQWRNLQVGWDESTAGERRNRVSIWEIEPVTAPFFICPPPFFRSKRPRQPGMPDDESSDLDNLFKRTMPWMGDDIFMKDSQALPGLSLVQWMNMQQNPSLSNSIQQNYMPTLPGPVLQNFPVADISRQLGFSAQQIPPQNSLQYNNAQRPSQQQVQQLDQLTQLPSTFNQLGSIMQNSPQLNDLSQQQRQNLISQSLSSSQVQHAQQLPPPPLVQNQNTLQQPPSSIQNQQLHKNQTQVQQQQPQVVGQNQLQNMMQSQPHDQMNHQTQIASQNQIQLQLLQKKLQQQKQHQQQPQQQQHQQQLLMSQHATHQQSSSHSTQLQDQQRPLLETSQSFSRSVIPSQIVEVPQATSQSHIVPQQIIKSTYQPKLQQEQAEKITEFHGHMGFHPSLSNNQLSMAGAPLGGQSVITDEAPSCSTSPSTNNGQNVVQPITHRRAHQSIGAIDDRTSLNSTVMGTVSSNTNSIKDLQQHNSDIRPSLNISKLENQGFFTPQNYSSVAAAQIDYLDASSSSTSVCISQNDLHYQQIGNMPSFNPQSILFRDKSPDADILADSRNANIPFLTNMDGQPTIPLNPANLITKSMMGLGKDFSDTGDILPNYENPKDPQQELSSSMVSQTFGMPDMTFNSIDSTVNDSSFWPSQPPQPFQRLRTYTKVYKRGAVGRSIDIARYSGYDELKQDLARRFGIEGQLEDRQRVGWKLVYVDHENDVLLVGDDPWEEFVNCVRCIKILSPQEVQQMSLDGDFGNSVLPNQACSSSDGGNA